MSLALYWDTETTGFNNAWLQEYAGLLVQTDTDTELWRADSLVQLPDGVVPEAGAFAVHNITAEMCKGGMPIKACCALFWEQVRLCDMIVGYNLEFDLRLMRTMSIRYEVQMVADKRVVELSNWAEHLCQLPPTAAMIRAKRHNYKRPSLVEAMRILCPSYDYKPHRAMPDVQACRVLHRSIKEQLDASKAKQTEGQETASASPSGGAEVPLGTSSGPVEGSA